MSETNGNGLASVEALFSRQPKRRHKTLQLPVSGHTVRIQSLTERELSEYQAAVLANRGGANSFIKARLIDANRRLIVLCLVDGAGNRILNQSHIQKLAEWDAADTSYLYNECAAHCGINREDIEETAKNSLEINVDSTPSA